MPIKSDLLAKAVKELAQMHHDAFVVELLGAEGSGLTVERIQELVAAKMVEPQKMAGWMVPGLRNSLDPYLFIRFVSKTIDNTPPEDRHKLRDWSIEDWTTPVDNAADMAWTQGGLELGGAVDYTAEKPQTPQTPPSIGIMTVDDPPAWM
jgi:hypothetical protein